LLPLKGMFRKLNNLQLLLMSHRDSHVNTILLKLFTNIHMRILSFLMSNGPSTYTEDAITVMSGGVWWRMKQEVPQGFLSRTYETPLAAQNC